jgi:hypothetical protein
MHHRNDLDAAAAVIKIDETSDQGDSMRMATVAVTAAAAAAVIASSVHAQAPPQPEAFFWSAPMGQQVPQVMQTESRPSTIDAAEHRALAKAIVDREEKAAGHAFEATWRDAVVDRLSMKSMTELQERLADSSHGLAGTPLFLGSSQADLSYTPVSPCRIIDTRVAGGQIAANTSRAFRVTGTGFTGQGGSPGSCGVPFGPATAAFINFTAVGATAAGPGNLAVTPSGSAFSTTSIVNWTAGANIGNGVAVPLCDPNATGCANDFDVKANVNSVHVIADVIGYFAAPQKTGLDVNVVVSSYFSCASGFDCGVTQPCTSGYIVTGGGCQLANYSFTFYWANNSPLGITNGWNCQGTNTSVSAQNMRTIAICSRTPGR